MDHLLDNPVWNALLTGSKYLGDGNEHAKVFHADIAPFAGMKEFMPQNFDALYDLVPFERTVAIVSVDDITISGKWRVSYHTELVQMIHDSKQPFDIDDTAIVSLNEEHVPDMAELIELTKPGPFYANTIKFGRYSGIFDQQKLVAITGFRMHVKNFIEVSAVCTHPDYLGKGYAGTLMKHAMNKIIAMGCTAFLHSRADNVGANRLYNHLGFTTRREMIINFIQKK